MKKTLLLTLGLATVALPLAAQGSDTVPANLLPPTYIAYQLVGEGRDLRGLEYEHGAYEARLREADGRMTKVILDPQTGQVISTRLTRHHGGTSAPPAVNAADAIQTVAMEGHWDIVELKHRDGAWRIKARDDAGQLGRFKLDASTGALVKAERR